MYVVSYDISNDRLRNKIAKELLNYGKRVQYSVFECHISKKQFEKLYMELTKLLSGETEGSIICYQLCKKCENEVQIIGVEESVFTKEEEDLFII